MGEVLDQKRDAPLSDSEDMGPSLSLMTMPEDVDEGPSLSLMTKPKQKKRRGNLLDPLSALLALNVTISVLHHEKNILDELPCAQMYENSYMHRDRVTHTATAPSGLFTGY